MELQPFFRSLHFQILEVLKHVRHRGAELVTFSVLREHLPSFFGAKELGAIFRFGSLKLDNVKPVARFAITVSHLRNFLCQKFLDLRLHE